MELTEETWGPSQRAAGQKRCRSCHGGTVSRKRVVVRRPNGSVRDIWRRDLTRQPEGTIVLKEYRGDTPKGETHDTLDFEFPKAFSKPRGTRLIRPKTPGYVYIVENDLFPGLCKIGCSNDPKARLGSARTWWPKGNVRIWISDPVADYREMEARVHQKLAHRQHVREWFSVDMELAKAIVIESMA